jgi:hypothetical protein
LGTVDSNEGNRFRFRRLAVSRPRLRFIPETVPDTFFTRAEVLAEYCDQLEAANLWTRFWLWQEIDREIDIRLDGLAPPDAHY